MSFRPLVAACSPAVTVFFTTGTSVVGFPFACGRGGADSASDSGRGAGIHVAGSVEPPELDESNSLTLRLLASASGAL
jgi:hypothetical protein